MIPRIAHRVIGPKVRDEYEQWWQRFHELHPSWAMMTHRDPLVRSEWPETAPYWNLTVSGGQFASLVRLEALWHHGGVYIDQDVEPYRSFEPLLPLRAFAAWEDYAACPDAVMGAEPHHPAIRECLDLAIARLVDPPYRYRETPRTGSWHIDQVIDTSVLVTTEVFPNRDDVLLLPPGAFYPYHYTEQHRRNEDFRKAQPWAFAAHHWGQTSWDVGEAERWQRVGPRSWD